MCTFDVNLCKINDRVRRHHFIQSYPSYRSHRLDFRFDYHYLLLLYFCGAIEMIEGWFVFLLVVLITKLRNGWKREELVVMDRDRMDGSDHIQ